MIVIIIISPPVTDFGVAAAFAAAIQLSKHISWERT